MRLILFSLSPLSSILFPQSHRYSFHANTAVLQLITHNLELRLLKLLFFFLWWPYLPRSNQSSTKKQLICSGEVWSYCLLLVENLPRPQIQNRSHSFQSLVIFHGACGICSNLSVPVMQLEINDIIILLAPKERGQLNKNFLAKFLCSKICTGYQNLQAWFPPRILDIKNTQLRLSVLGGPWRTRWCVDRSRHQVRRRWGERRGWREGSRPQFSHCNLSLPP